MAIAATIAIEALLAAMYRAQLSAKECPASAYAPFSCRTAGHQPAASLLLELGQPALLIAAYSSRTIRWRTRRIRRRSLSAFEYV